MGCLAVCAGTDMGGTVLELTAWVSWARCSSATPADVLLLGFRQFAEILCKSVSPSLSLSPVVFDGIQSLEAVLSELSESNWSWQQLLS